MARCFLVHQLRIYTDSDEFMRGSGDIITIVFPLRLQIRIFLLQNIILKPDKPHSQLV